LIASIRNSDVWNFGAGNQGDHPIEEDDPELARIVVRLRVAEHPRAVRDLNLSRQHGLDQALHLGGQMLAIGIQGDDDPRVGIGEQPIARPQGGTAATVDHVPGDDPAVLSRELPGAVTRAVIDHEDGGFDSAHLVGDAVEYPADALGLVVGRHEHSDLVAEALRMAGDPELLPGKSLEHLGQLPGDSRPLRQRPHDQQEEDQDREYRDPHDPGAVRALEGEGAQQRIE
jgi:hypothetical protein